MRENTIIHRRLLSKNSSSISQFLRWLTQSHPSLTDKLSQRRSSLLAAMTATIFILGGVYFINGFITDPTTPTRPDTPFIVAGFIITMGVYLLNRVGRVKLAAGIFIAILTFVFVIVPFIRGFQSGTANTTFYYNAVPVLLTAVFFSVRTTLYVAGGILVSIVGLSVATGAQSVSQSASQFLFLVFSIIFIFIRHLQFQEGLRAKELESINQALRASEESLEQRVEERTSELNAALEQAERANSAKSIFLSSMSHELRTPLNAIINFTRFVAKGSMGAVTDRQQETLNEVIDSAKHLLNLINDVLDMSKIESGSLQLFVEPNVDLNAILKKVHVTGKTLLAEKPVELQAEIDEDFPKISGDRQRILQILLNIMSNACKFTEDGHIRLYAYREDDEVVISIEDTGPGIAAQDHPLVFEAFKQTATGLRQAGGTGLGMPISRSLTEAHGGRLWLESEPGSGSVFYVALPIKSTILNPEPQAIA